MTIRTTLPIGIVSIALLAGCSDPGTPGTDTAAAPEPQAQAPTGTPPAQRTEFRIPPETFEPDPAAGFSLFATHCAACHGPEALGTDQGPPLIHRIYEPSHHSDLAFYRAIALGVHQHHWEFGDMPPVPGVTGEGAAHIIAWIRTEQRAAGIE
ncbi:cytochrome c [Thioalkalivibrio nitratireducens DSM 14787]|uniref:Cytochrome c n=1 Tax=Thioalkalivibrio nitratireducens (strain DSM 14787 / UNIQEM 213 / ALEN2) TaxID=1255043 RepID=L0DT43_THIND|nr:cytochrome c [Thioalkalivibrio nitratireducens]AGA32779.1 cytochrome c [Thioalkalivibrio nitratireducens DSM 14787]